MDNEPIHFFTLLPTRFLLYLLTCLQPFTFQFLSYCCTTDWNTDWIAWTWVGYGADLLLECTWAAFGFLPCISCCLPAPTFLLKSVTYWGRIVTRHRIIYNITIFIKISMSIQNVCPMFSLIP